MAGEKRVPKYDLVDIVLTRSMHTLQLPVVWLHRDVAEIVLDIHSWLFSRIQN
jgi:hypothetical protein